MSQSQLCECEKGEGFDFIPFMLGRSSALRPFSKIETQTDMMSKTTPLNYDLLAQKKWREFLLSVPDDRNNFDLTFDSIEQMKSFKSTAYEINSDRVGDKAFSLSLDKPNLRITVTVLRR